MWVLTVLLGSLIAGLVRNGHAARIGLWLLSLGRYRPDGQGGLLLEGAVGLLAVAVVIWLTSR